MLVLVLDTATPAVTAAVAAVDPGSGAVEVRAAVSTVDARRHGELLAPAVREVLARSGHGAGALTAVVAGVGPGPFTGLRVGLVTAAALADALGIATYGVCSLDGIATATGERLLVATDARRREMYWATYDRAGHRDGDPAVDRPAEVAARLPDLGVTAMAGARQFAEVLALPWRGPRFPDPATLVARAADRIRAAAPSQRLVPLYLRRPDAATPTAPKRVTPPRPR